jgi:DNA mismatch endonuclease (patch repair protein)
MPSMTDILTPAQRSEVMSRIRGRDTKPEMTIRRTLHGLGFRYRLHRRDLPGKPDIVLSRWKTVVLVNGCFFHGHACPAFRLPSSNQDFWLKKIRRNQERDAVTAEALRKQGWRVVIVWECALRGPRKIGPGRLGDVLAAVIQGNEVVSALVGVPAPEG